MATKLHILGMKQIIFREIANPSTGGNGKDLSNDWRVKAKRYRG